MDGTFGGIGGILSYHCKTNVFVNHFDDIGNIEHISDVFGKSLLEFRYSPFGELPAEKMGSVCRFGFGSKEYDCSTKQIYYGFRFFSSAFGRWLSRDYLGEMYSENRYAFCWNAPNNCVDYLGLRNVTITIYHNLPDEDLTQRAKDEVERIFQECFAKCDEKGSHHVDIQWKKTEKTSENYKDLDLGMSGGNIFGFNPTKVGKFVDKNAESKISGYSDRHDYSFVNPVKIRNESTDYDIGMAVAIAHEVGFHGIGRYTDIFSDYDDSVDARHPPSSGHPSFSEKRCQGICDALDIDTKADHECN